MVQILLNIYHHRPRHNVCGEPFEVLGGGKTEKLKVWMCVADDQTELMDRCDQGLDVPASWTVRKNHSGSLEHSCFVFVVAEKTPEESANILWRPSPCDRDLSTPLPAPPHGPFLLRQPAAGAERREWKGKSINWNIMNGFAFGRGWKKWWTTMQRRAATVWLLCQIWDAMATLSDRKFIFSGLLDH